MNKKTSKYIILIVLVLFVLTFFVDINFSFDFHEFEHCEDKQCKLCLIIQQASDFIKMFSIILIICLFNDITKITEKLKVKVINCVSNTPINNKVQLNE